MKYLTEETQKILGESVVRSYHIVQSALKNLKVVRRKIHTSSGVKYQIDLKRAREAAKERGITKERICPRCNLHITENQETFRDKNGEIIHKTCSSVYDRYPRRPHFCHLCGEEMLKEQKTEVIAGRRAHTRCYEDQMRKQEEEMESYLKSEKAKESERSSGKMEFKWMKTKEEKER